MTRIHAYIARHHGRHLKRYESLSDDNRAIADKVIIRHVVANARLGIGVEGLSIYSILEDAAEGRDVTNDIEPGEPVPESYAQSTLTAYLC